MLVRPLMQTWQALLIFAAIYALPEKLLWKRVALGIALLLHPLVW